MSAVMSSMAEIVRVGGWALRGLGLPFGVAERAVPLLAWTEAATGGGMRSLRLGEDDIVASFAAPRLQQADAGRLLGHGRHLLEIGPPAVDLATVAARKSGQARLTLACCIGMTFVPALAGMLAHRGLAGRMTFNDERVQSLDFQPGFVGAPIAGDAACSPGDLVIDCRVGPHGAVPDGENLAARVDAAWAAGVPTTEDDLRYLYQLEMRTWAPTSERSRSQAGYGKF